MHPEQSAPMDEKADDGCVGVTSQLSTHGRESINVALYRPVTVYQNRVIPPADGVDADYGGEFLERTDYRRY